MVEVTAPDGTKSLGAVAVAPGAAVEAVKKMTRQIMSQNNR